jgi:hypothetical protein
MNKTLADLARQIGVGVDALSFGIQIDDAPPLTADDFELQAEHVDGVTCLRAARGALCVDWRFEAWGGGLWVTLTCESAHAVRCRSLTSLALNYSPTAANDALANYWFSNSGKDVHTVGLFKIDELSDQNRTDKRIRSVFKDSRNPGLFLGTRIPQTHEHEYTLTRAGDTLHCASATLFGKGSALGVRFVSEASWVCASKTALAAQDAYAAHLPQHTIAPAEIPLGWNSWDYYASSVGLDDLRENLAALQRDAFLAARMKFIVIDMGWEHMPGEWEPNHRFPGGLRATVDAITACNFVPGIWTAPTIVQNPTRTAQRNPDMLLKDDFGDPIHSEHFSNAHVLDPTHPLGEAFLRELYTRLYRHGFRLFKVDYAYEFSAKHNYFRREFGCYDVWRHLFRIIRECVGDSHIIGCGLPAECGAGLVDSNRIGVDIHNHWSHVEWVCDFLQFAYWQHGRIAINDPDFLIVRGRDTSIETQTNMLNINAHNPNYRARWRRGPVFTQAEAQTWASIVMLAGGSLFLSDRINHLNAAGRGLIETALTPLCVAAHPLDLCDVRRASLWLQQLASETRLTVINWDATPVTHSIDFAALGLRAPAYVTELWCQQRIMTLRGACAIELPAHASAVLIWSNTQ